MRVEREALDSVLLSSMPDLLCFVFLFCGWSTDIEPLALHTLNKSSYVPAILQFKSLLLLRIESKSVFM